MRIRRRIRRRGLKRVLSLAACCALAVTIVPSTAHASEATQESSDLETSSEIEYGVGTAEVVWVKAPDGADIYIELYRPVAGVDGIAPPDQYPVILRMTPYEGTFSARYFEIEGSTATPPRKGFSWDLRDRYVPQGYAFAIGHVYGTGNSEGCLEMYGDNEIAATSATVEALASQPWSNGNVGMIGTSYDAGEAMQVAARGSDAAKERLKAVVALDGPSSLYEISSHDGVPAPPYATAFGGSYAYHSQAPAVLSPLDPSEPDPLGVGQRIVGACRAENLAASAELDVTGNFSEWLAERSARDEAHQVRAAMLMYEGFHDGPGVGAMAAVGYFDRIDKHIPRRLVLGQWDHASPSTYLADFWYQADAWFGRYLLDLDTGVEELATVEVQDSTGSWRSEKTWPATGTPLGQLALTSAAPLGSETDGGLGGSEPSGSTTYVEARPFTSEGKATFSTGPLSGPLHIAGLPVLDLWVELDQNDAHIAVQLHAFDEAGKRLTSTDPSDNGSKYPLVGARSAQHLDPITDGEFRQQDPFPVPYEHGPIHVPVRFMLPMDLVVPKGGWITIDVTGVAFQGLTPFLASGSQGEVTILHDCAHPSVLRFVMPKEEPDWLQVPMVKPVPQTSPLTVEPGLRDGGGIASQRVCGEKPADPSAVVVTA